MILAAAVAAGPAAAQVTSMVSANPAPKGSNKDLNKIVCEVSQTTGTRLGARKVCKTVLEWQQMRSEHRVNLEGVQRQATSTGCPNGQFEC
jgi:hypothetical protein